jgi:S-DNA-T family DNA segregation ATPase FtsK/SpoIIIE
MSTTTVKRGPRQPGPDVPQGTVVLQPPPELPRDGRDGGWALNLLPMLAGLGSVAFFFMPGANSLMMIMGGVTFASSLAFVGVTAVRQRNGGKGKVADARRDYLRYLAQVRTEVTATATAQRQAALWTHPDPRQLWSVVATGDRLWERRPGDADFLAVRLGTGPQKLASQLVPPDTAPLDELEPMCADALRRFLAVRGSLPEMPVAVPMRSVARVLIGGGDDAYGAVCAALAQSAVFHSPEDLQICVLAQGGRAERWEWLKWLPHVQHPTAVDATGPQRMIYDDLADAERDLAPILAERPRFTPSVTLVDRPHLVLVLDTGASPSPTSSSRAASQLLPEDGLMGVTALELTADDDVEARRHQLAVRFRTADKSSGSTLRADIEFPDSRAFPLLPDDLAPAQAEALARQLAPLKLSSGGVDEPLLQALEFTDLLGIGDAADIEPLRLWGPASRTASNDRLRVPIGVGEDGRPVLLDLKEAALGGMGPHGLCVGATGSGKSELLRSLVAALALTHSSDSVNFILADFKGGATFAGLASLPHVAAVITNLADDLSLVDRMRDALTGELNRRQELLRDNGNHKNIHDYEKARTAALLNGGSAAADLVPMPSLVLIVDEFSELLTARPEFIDMFLQIGRIGRSLGVHLLLASQRLEEGRLRGLDTYLSYRLGLKTFSAGESRAVLGVSDAHTLPSVPGSGYLKYDTESMTRFKAAYVSGPYGRAKAMTVPAARSSAHRQSVRFTALHQAPVVDLHSRGQGRGRGPGRGTDPDLTATTSLVSWDAAARYQQAASTVLDVIVDRLAGQGPAAHQVWLPPLDESPTLDQLLPGIAVTEARGLAATGWPGTGRLVVPIGIVDKPAEQRQDPQTLDLSGAGGHVLVVGGPRSGKSTCLRTLMFSLALTHTPAEVRFLGLDFGGGALAPLAGMPHVSGIAGRSNPDLVRRIVAETVGILDRREADGEVRAAKLDESHVFLVVDGWAAFRGEFEALEQDVVDIARRGLGYGVHLVLATGRWADVRAQLKDAVTTRVELRLGDPMESEMDRRTAAEVPHGVPGRGVTKAKLHTLGALPEAEADELVTAIDRAWPGARAPKVRMLPSQVSYPELLKSLPATTIPGQRTPGGVPIGVEESKLSAVRLDFAAEPHFLVFGENESGKSNLLRLVAHGVCEAADAGEIRAMCVVVDYRRSLMGAVPERYDAGYVVAGPAAAQLMAELAPALKERLPGPEVTREQLRRRSWWTGKDVFVLVDDYDLVATAAGNPLTPLVELLPYARDIGLHLIVARQSGGAGRALFDPLLQRLRELNAPGLLLSGDRDEGQLIGGARPSRQPAGRGQLVSRRWGTVLVQTAWLGGEESQGEVEAVNTLGE